MKDFDLFINETNLRDPSIGNVEFTWTNGRVHSRLDRFIFTMGWEDLFPTVRQGALVRIESDHFPIILDTNPFKWGPSPFRFENMWLSHRGFLDKIKEWRGCEVEGWEGFKFLKKLELMKHKIKKWTMDIRENSKD